MKGKSLAAIAVFLLVSGCSTLRCGEPGPYMAAETVDPLVVPEGLSQPNHSRALRVPQAADVVHPELQGNRVIQPDGSMHCLESPPPSRGRR